ncbi:DUF397 domain-containing protein [Streptomyces sp. HUAS 31]|uniref:DUF397 domain-containing protein n=1 Tax=Streptomyces TaxID=1883 RepID=UPI0023056E00|nr:DUF397 domain-containing protein [Streptomyces sp. HUAS 31]WCD96507.1 DUF397 domain-containing protein [Streptomyces sp. HUAS 31]
MESTEMLTAIQWRKSSYSGDQGGECVEVGESRTSVAIRDSKNTAGPMLAFEPATFTAFLDWTTAAE